MMRRSVNNTICLVMPYFGTPPSYWHGYIDSLSDNLGIDFLIVTDFQVEDLPPNAKWLNISWGKMQESIRKILVDLGIKKPCVSYQYKLCDYKPLYGLLFREELRGYDYWGYMDCDLVLGDVLKFLNCIEYDKYDRIYRYGHLSLYRNTDEINNLFQECIEDYENIKDVASTSFMKNFDERGINEIFKLKNLRFFEGMHDATFSIYDFAFRKFNLGRLEMGELFVKEADGSTKVYYETEDGIVNIKEVNYIHFITKKHVDIPKKMSRPYCISHKGVFYIGDMSINEAMTNYAYCTEDEQADFLKQETWRFRKKSLCNIIRELKFNKFIAIKNIWGRIKSWRHSLKFCPNKSII